MIRIVSFPTRLTHGQTWQCFFGELLYYCWPRLRTAVIASLEVLSGLSRDAIKAGVWLGPSDFKLETRERSSLPSAFVSSFNEVRQSCARSLIVANQVITKEMITKDCMQGDTFPTRKGFQVIEIPLSATTIVKGQVTVGAKVDLRWDREQNGKHHSEVIVNDLEVISIQRTNQDTTSMTLLVPEIQAQKILQAQRQGQLVLTLRKDLASSLNREIGAAN